MCANYVTSANHLNYANCTNCSTTAKLQLLQTCKNATYLTDTCVNCVNEGLFGVGLESSWGWPEFITGSRWLSNLLEGVGLVNSSWTTIVEAPKGCESGKREYQSRKWMTWRKLGWSPPPPLLVPNDQESIYLLCLCFGPPLWTRRCH